MFRFATVSVLVVSGLVVGQSVVRSQLDVPIADKAAQVAQSSTSVPQQINHQGVVSVSGVRFNGVGSFKFAIFDPGTGFNLWCNDPADADSNGIQDCKEVVGAEPVNSVTLTVKDGEYVPSPVEGLMAARGFTRYPVLRS